LGRKKKKKKKGATQGPTIGIRGRNLRKASERTRAKKTFFSQINEEGTQILVAAGKK